MAFVNRTKKNAFEEVSERIMNKVDDLVGQSVKRTVNKVRTKVLKEQNKLLSFIVTGLKLTGADTAPSFPGITLPQPKFEPLGETYLKEKKTTPGDPQFFRFKGYLERYLYNSSIKKVITNFGEPEIAFIRDGRAGSTSKTYRTSSGDWKEIITDRKGKKIKDFTPLKRLGKVEIDLYPKIKGKLKQDMVMGDYFPRLIAYRLDNLLGSRDREFMPQYLEWWLKVKIKNAVKGIV